MLPSVDYSKTVIYKITCNDPSVTDVYVGSTSDFIRRKTEHKSRCINDNLKSCKYRLYHVIRLHGVNIFKWLRTHYKNSKTLCLNLLDLSPFKSIKKKLYFSLVAYL